MLAASFSDACQIQQSAAGPLGMWQRGDGNTIFQFPEHAGSPIAVFGPGHDRHLGLFLASKPVPRIEVGWKLLLQHKNFLPPGNRQVESGGGQWVAGPRDDWDV